MILQAGEIVAGYTVMEQRWRWLDYGWALAITVRLHPERRLTATFRYHTSTPPIWVTSGAGDRLRELIEERAITGGPWD